MAEKQGFFSKIKAKVKNYWENNRTYAELLLFTSGLFIGGIAVWSSMHRGKSELGSDPDYDCGLAIIQDEDENKTDEGDVFYLCLDKKPYEDDEIYEGFVEQMYDTGLLVLNSHETPVVNSTTGDPMHDAMIFKLKVIQDGGKERLKNSLNSDGYELEYMGKQMLI